jgi:hypothetical protein
MPDNIFFEITKPNRFYEYGSTSLNLHIHQPTMISYRYQKITNVSLPQQQLNAATSRLNLCFQMHMFK